MVSRPREERTTGGVGWRTDERLHSMTSMFPLFDGHGHGHGELLLLLLLTAGVYCRAGRGVAERACVHCTYDTPWHTICARAWLPVTTIRL